MSPADRFQNCRYFTSRGMSCCDAWRQSAAPSRQALPRWLRRAAVAASVLLAVLGYLLALGGCIAGAALFALAGFAACAVYIA